MGNNIPIPDFLAQLSGFYCTRGFTDPNRSIEHVRQLLQSHGMQPDGEHNLEQIAKAFAAEAHQAKGIAHAPPWLKMSVEYLATIAPDDLLIEQGILPSSIPRVAARRETKRRMQYNPQNRTLTWYNHLNGISKQVKHGNYARKK